MRGKLSSNLKSQRKHLYTSVTKQDILSHLDHNLYDAVCITLPYQIGFFFSCLSIFPKSLGKFFHSVGKSQKKSHSILRAKRATFTVLVDKSSRKMTILASFWEKHVVKQCYQTSQFWLGKKWWKTPKLDNWNDTFLVISKHCYTNSVTRQVTFNETKFKCDILSNFQTLWKFFKSMSRIQYFPF